MFGVSDDIGKPAVEAAVAKLSPLLRDVENRLATIIHEALDRLNGTEIIVRIVIPPKLKDENDGA